MRTRRTILVVATNVAILLFSGVSWAQKDPGESRTLALPPGGGMDSGRASKKPWSSSFFPNAKGDMVRALRVYDYLFGRKAAPIELKAHPPAKAQKWEGHCHCWCPASMLYPEPRYPIVGTGDRGRSRVLSVGVQKALLLILHDDDPAEFFGRRYQGKAGEDIQDIYPVPFWKALDSIVKEHRRCLMVDTEASSPVWNYPVYEYHVRYYPISSGMYRGHMKILMADDSVPPNYVGTRVKTKTYLFTFRMVGGSPMLSGSRWQGVSVKDHPDFAWYPTGTRPKNPEVDVSRILRLVSTGRRASAPGSRDMVIPDEPGEDMQDSEELETGRVIPVSSSELVALLARKSTSFPVQVNVTPLGNSRPVAGRPFSVRCTATKSGYLYLFGLAPSGDLQLLFPVPGQDNRIATDKTLEVGAAGSQVKFTYPAATGKFRIKGLITSRPLGLGRLEPAPAQQSGQARHFAWDPSEAEMAQGLLRDLIARKITPREVEQQTGVEPLELVGEFGQQEVIAEVVSP